MVGSKIKPKFDEGGKYLKTKRSELPIFKLNLEQEYVPIKKYHHDFKELDNPSDFELRKMGVLQNECTVITR